MSKKTGISKNEIPAKENSVTLFVYLFLRLIAL